MRARRRSTLVVTVLCLAACAAQARASEIIDQSTVRNNMHSCPPGFIMTGVHVGNDDLLCTGRFENSGQNLTVNEVVDSGNPWPPDTETRVAHNYTGPDMHWCGPDRFMTGVHVGNNQFNCSRFTSTLIGRNYTTSLGHVIVDGSTSRSGMHACPRGTILVGAHFGSNLFLCAELPFCEDTSHCPGASDVCEFNSVTCSTCIVPFTGVCRRPDTLDFRSGGSCTQSSVGSLTARSGNVATSASTGGSFVNDSARSVSFGNIKAGTIIKIYDSSTGSEADDWTQIFAKTDGAGCTPSFETSFDGPGVKVDVHPFDGLDARVSRVDVRSAILDYAGRCLDINASNFSLQVFDCHGGVNQSWIYQVNGEIRGWNNQCLEANSSEIHTWPSLPAGQVRRASLRMSNCNGSIFQKWSVTETGQIRMFSGMCLDIQGGPSFNQAPVQIYPCNGGQNQFWRSSF